MDNEYAIYFKYGDDGDEGLRLPVNPENFKIKIPSKNETYSIIGLGDINIIKEPGLREISFEGFLPADAQADYVLTKDNFIEPTVYLDFWRRIKEEKKPFTFIVNRYLSETKRIHDTNMDMTLEDYEVTEIGGEPGDFYYSLLLREYRPYSIGKVE